MGIIGAVPSEIGRLANLLTFYAPATSISSLPSELWRMSSLTAIQIQYLPLLSMSMPTEIGQLTLLRTLYCQGTPVRGTIPTQIGRVRIVAFLMFLLAGSRSLVVGTALSAREPVRMASCIDFDLICNPHAQRSVKLAHQRHVATRRGCTTAAAATAVAELEFDRRYLARQFADTLDEPGRGQQRLGPVVARQHHFLDPAVGALRQQRQRHWLCSVAARCAWTRPTSRRSTQRAGNLRSLEQLSLAGNRSDSFASILSRSSRVFAVWKALFRLSCCCCETSRH